MADEESLQAQLRRLESEIAQLRSEIASTRRRGSDALQRRATLRLGATPDARDGRGDEATEPPATRRESPRAMEPAAPDAGRIPRHESGVQRTRAAPHDRDTMPAMPAIPAIPAIPAMPAVTSTSVAPVTPLAPATEATRPARESPTPSRDGASGRYALVFDPPKRGSRSG